MRVAKSGERLRWPMHRELCALAASRHSVAIGPISSRQPAHALHPVWRQLRRAAVWISCERSMPVQLANFGHPLTCARSACAQVQRLIGLLALNRDLLSSKMWWSCSIIFLLLRSGGYSVLDSISEGFPTPCLLEIVSGPTNHSRHPVP